MAYKDPEKKAAYLEANKERLAAYRKVYREANKERIAAYLEATKEKRAASKKAYLEANKEKRAAYLKAYSEANSEKLRAKGRQDVEVLKQFYVVARLRDIGADVTPETIEIKRTQIILKRTIKELKNV